MYEARSQIAGVIHMGWKSLERGIVENVSAYLKKHGRGAVHLICGVGLRKCCYEVGTGVLNGPLTNCVEAKSGRDFFDPIDFVTRTFGEHGIPFCLFDTGLCSLCSQEPFFSYRRNHARGRTLNYIVKQ